MPVSTASSSWRSAQVCSVSSNSFNSNGCNTVAGNDTCPIVGHHDTNAKFVIPAAKESGKPPFICSKLPQFVETRGGDYFFLPSMTALRMIAMGTIDPT